jgi:hypothetical protein
MRHLRFNIASLLGVILFLGVGFAALKESNDLWDSGLFTLTTGVLLVSTLLAVYRRKARRAFWIGFALLGWGYLALSVVPAIESRLLTSKGLAYLDSKVPGRPSPVYSVVLTTTGSGGPGNQIQNISSQNIALTINGTTTTTSSQGVLKLWDATTGKLLSGWSGTTENFVRIGHSLFALVAAWLGGHLSRRLYRKSRPAEESAASEAQVSV